MPVYVVSYDLKQGSGTHDYADLYEAFDALDSHRVLLSVFIVSTNMSADDLKGYLTQHMDPKDRIWVSRMTGRANTDYAYTAMTGTNAWLKRNPPS